MADTGPVPDQSVVPPHLDDPGCVSVTPKLISPSTEHSSLASHCRTAQGGHSSLACSLKFSSVDTVLKKTP